MEGQTISNYRLSVNDNLSIKKGLFTNARCVAQRIVVDHGLRTQNYFILTLIVT